MDWSWIAGGITEELPRSTGPGCITYISTKRKLIEGIIVVFVCILAIKYALSRLHPINFIILPTNLYSRDINPPIGKQILLVLMTFIFGMEIGFKLATKTFIYALNPCHVTTIMQIYLLATKPSKTSTIIFRIQMNLLNGPLLACIFPDAESRQLPFEATTYWIQHGLMFIITIYLLRLGGAYQMEHIFDFRWNIIGYAICLIYHFLVLQIASMMSNINLNHMLCPATSDPFQGQNYRICAIFHQAFLCPFLCKLFTLLFSKTSQIQLDVKIIKNNNQTMYKDYDNELMTTSITGGQSSIAAKLAARLEDQIMTTKID